MLGVVVARHRESTAAISRYDVILRGRENDLNEDSLFVVADVAGKSADSSLKSLMADLDQVVRQTRQDDDMKWMILSIPS